MGREIVVADIGGTHARFAIASIEADKTISLTDYIKMKTSGHAGLQAAWRAYGAELGRTLPPEAALAVAASVGGDIIEFTNCAWKIKPALIPQEIGVERYSLVNDFEAVAHAAMNVGPDQYDLICGPEVSISSDGVTTVIGAGTGLGVAQVLQHGENYYVTGTEGGHINFAPLDHVEDRLLARLREQHQRVSAERIVSGPGIAAIYHTLAQLEGKDVEPLDDKEIWRLALSDQDSLSAAALNRFCLCLGSVAGDLALAQGANSVVIAGDLGRRIADILPSSGFQERFLAKGRFKSMMERIPVRQLLHEEPGLYGAALAFLQEHDGPTVR